MQQGSDALEEALLHNLHQVIPEGWCVQHLRDAVVVSISNGCEAAGCGQLGGYRCSVAVDTKGQDNHTSNSSNQVSPVCACLVLLQAT